LLPREKALKFGVSSLSDDELLAILLSVGSQGMDVFTLARSLLRDFSLKDLSGLPIKALMRIKGIGEAKAVRLAAAFELGRRLYAPHDEILTTEHLRSVLAPLGRSRRETLLLAMYDSAGRFLGTEIVAVGRLNIIHIHPREIFEPIFRSGATGFVIAHNHPDGDPTPSPEDAEFTEKMDALAGELGITLIESFIVVRDRAVGILGGTTLNLR